jgi:ABC-type nitrate/sulfonate/bicarbonate transport system ATPase subunit
MSLFTCEHITKLYEGEKIIEDISLNVDEGNFISLLGPSGVGKTTLFNILAGIDTADIGRVYLEDCDISGISGKVSYMPQNDLLFEHRTIIDNIILPLLIRKQKKSEARKYAAQFFNDFGLSGYEKKYPFQLSGGERQRAALLRTCMMHNKMMLLDEPFSALDAISKIQMRKWYKGVARTMGITTLFITHDIDEAIELSDSIYIINQKPGIITKKFSVTRLCGAGEDFYLKPEYAALKKNILDELEL